MGIRIIEAIQICKLLRHLQKINSAGLEICVLGYPDLLFTAKDLAKYSIFKDINLNDLQVKEYSSDFSPKNKYNFIDPCSFFDAFNAKFTVIDVVKHRGNEIILDLNYPNVTSVMASQFDLAIDNGTLEHCFNIGEALINMARLVKSQGFVFHINPLSMINHGFYNICPTLLYDFYTLNDFEYKSAIASGITSQIAIDVHPTNRFSITKQFKNEEVILNFTAQKFPNNRLQCDKYQKYLYPVQSKYKPLIEKN